MESFRNFDNALDEVAALSLHAEKLLSEGERNLANAITRSGVVLLSGYVEGFVRDLIGEAVDEIDNLELAPDALPSGLLVSVLQAIVDASGQKQEEKLDLLKEAWRNGAACDLNRKKLSATGGNPTVDTIEALFRALGLNVVIDRLSIEHFGVDSTFVKESQSSEMKESLMDVLAGDVQRVDAVLSLIDKKWQPRVKRREVGYVSALQELLKKRNRIAHGEGSEIVTPQELEEHVSQMRGLGAGLDGLVVTLIGELAKKL